MVTPTHIEGAPRQVAPSAWAKLNSEGRWLPLEDHAGDVGTVLAALIGEFGKRYPSLTAQQAERLTVLAYLHDLGKANRGFWKRQFPNSPMIGHTSVTAALFHHFGGEGAVIKLDALIEDWGCFEIFPAVMAHHGKPLDVYSCVNPHEPIPPSIQEKIDDGKQFWMGDGGYSPIAELERLLDAAKTRYPLAFQPGPLLPQDSEFVALYCGMVTLADWLGSDPVLFPIDGPNHNERHRLQAANAIVAASGRGLLHTPTPAGDFADAFQGWQPQGVQVDAGRMDLGQIALIEAETGAGKTEAALWRWLELRRAGLVDGIYFALPTRSAAVQLHGRVQQMLNAVFGDGCINAVMALPGYLRAGDDEGQALPAFEVVWPDSRESDGRWAAESPKRFLTARVAVGTIDQALMAGLKLKHAHFRMAALSRNLLVVDEVHASDAFMTETLKAVLKNHSALGGHALLLSATLGSSARADLLGHAQMTFDDACGSPYPAISGTNSKLVSAPVTSKADKSVSIVLKPWMDSYNDVASCAAAAANMGASVLIVRNSVAGAIATAKAVEEMMPAAAFRVNGFATLHHGRFAPEDRRLLDAAVEREFGKGRTRAGRILVGTQTLEQSLDIDADLLITDLAPIDVLLQRIGRLHRHQRPERGDFARAQVMVMQPKERDLSRYLGKVKERHGLGPMRDGSGVYPDLVILEATLRLLEANPFVSIPADNRRLVEGALHSSIKDEITAELGSAWVNHANSQAGRSFADRGTARLWSLDISKPFTSLQFTDPAEAISTRLGLKNRIVDLPHSLLGPFGGYIRRLSIPGWMTRGATSEDQVADIDTNTAGVIRFKFAGRQFQYDRFGLTECNE